MAMSGEGSDGHIWGHAVTFGSPGGKELTMPRISTTPATARITPSPAPKYIAGPNPKYPWLRPGDKLPVFPHLKDRNVLGVGGHGLLGNVAKDGVTVVGMGGYGIVGHLGADGKTVYSDRGGRAGKGDGVLGEVGPAPREPAKTRPVTPRPDPGTAATGWSNKPNAARELRSMLTSEPGKMLFAELVENQVNDPSAETGYVWLPQEARPMKWTLAHQDVGDDSLGVSISGTTLTIEAEASELKGEATIKGTSRQELTRAIRGALADLERAQAAARR